MESFQKLHLLLCVQKEDNLILIENHGLFVRISIDFFQNDQFKLVFQCFYVRQVHLMLVLAQFNIQSIKLAKGQNAWILISKKQN